MNAAPAVAVLEGCVWIVNLLAAAAFTTKLLLTAFVIPLALAVSCLLPNPLSIRKSV